MDARPLARWTGATCLVAAPLAYALGTLFPTFGQEDPIPQQLADIAANPGAISAQNLLGVPLLLVVPAMLFVALLVRRGAPRLSLIGGGITVFAWMAGMVAFGAQGLVYEAAAGVPDRAAAVPVLEAFGATPTFTVLLLTYIAGHTVGMVLLGIGIARSRVAPVWVGVAFALVPVLNVVANFVGPIAAGVTAVVFLVALGYLAAVLVRMPDDDWDVAPVTDPARVPSPV